MSLSVSLSFIFSDLLMMKNTKTVAVPTVLTDAKTIEAIAYNIAAMAQIQPSMWGPRFTTRNSRYAYNSRSHDQYVVSPHNQADIKVTSSIIVPNKKSYNWSHDQD
jgi:hypothetical protein